MQDKGKAAVQDVVDGIQNRARVHRCPPKQGTEKCPCCSKGCPRLKKGKGKVDVAQEWVHLQPLAAERLMEEVWEVSAAALISSQKPIYAKVQGARVVVEGESVYGRPERSD